MLCSDLFVFAELQGLTLSIKGLKNLGKGGMYKMQGRLTIDSSFDVRDLPDKDKEQEQHRFMVISLQKAFIVTAENAQEKQDWLRDIRAAIDTV